MLPLNAKDKEKQEGRKQGRWFIAFLTAVVTLILAFLGFVVSCVVFNPWLFILMGLWLVIGVCNLYTYGRKLNYWEDMFS